jgi:hypothetical protein
MVRYTVDFGPSQDPITLESIRQIVQLSPRRTRLSTEWPQALHHPAKEGQDWSLVLPFPETLWNAFDQMCSVQNIGRRTNAAGRCYTFLKTSDSDELNSVRAAISTIGKFVAIRDCLSLSFALDYDRDGGDPAGVPTAVGELRRKAKPYGKQVTSKTTAAADRLVKMCSAFLREMSCYSGIDGVAAVPPSVPDPEFNLPIYIASELAKRIGTKDLADLLKTTKARQSLKNVSLDEKLNSLVGTIEVTGKVGSTILLIDDLSTNPARA